jgi:hypothetical protein
MRVDLHIERLVLEGFPVGRREGDLVAKVLQAELVRLFAEHAIPTSLLAGSAVPVLRADTVQFGPPVTPQPLGRQIARAVHGTIAT